MSFHNKQGLENIFPIAKLLSENESNEITLLDLRSMYAQPISNLEIPKNIKVIKDRSIFKNIRNLNKLNKLIFLFSKFLKIKYFGTYFDVYIFSPGGFYEGRLTKKFRNNSKKTYFIEAGAKIYLFLNSQKELQPKKTFLDNVNGYFTTGESPKIKLETFTNKKSVIFNYGVPRYANIVGSYKTSNNYQSQQINNLLFLTSAASYHKVDWESSWQAKIIEEIINSSLLDSYILNVKVHPRDNFSDYKKYKNLKNVNILNATDIESDIRNNHCIISGPSSSIHEVSFLGRIYTVIWPFDNYKNEYLSSESLVKNVDELFEKISKLKNDLNYQSNLFDMQLLGAQKFINIDSDSSAKKIIEHIIKENKKRN